MNQASEKDLLNRAKSLDPTVLTEIYTIYSPGIYRFAMRLLGDDCLAEDCVSETFSRYLKAIRAGQGPQDHLQAYIYRIAHNWVTDCYRRQPPPPLELDDSIPESEYNSPETEAFKNLEKQSVRLALRSLTPDQRQVVTLRFIEGWNYDEIELAMNKPAGAIRALQFRGLTTLRKILKQINEKAGIHVD